MKEQAFFSRFARMASSAAGNPWAFILAGMVVLVWAVTGPIFKFNDTWQLVINTGTTIVTFLMVFLVQNSQNRDGMAIQIKLDEIIRSVQGASNTLIDLEEATDAEIEQARQRFNKIAEAAKSGRVKVKVTRRRPAKKRRATN
jgi:low affinity Fe/Cu permease